MSGTPGHSGGSNRKSAEQHRIDGTFRADRHGVPVTSGSSLARPNGPIPKAPRGLSAASGALWRRIHEAYVLTKTPDHDLLESALRSLDVAERAREQLEREGLTVNAAGKMKAHPCVAIARDHRAAFISTMKVLGFPVPPTTEEEHW